MTSLPGIPHALIDSFRVSYARARRIAIVGASVGWIGAALFIALGPGSNRSVLGPMKWADFPHFHTIGSVARARDGALLYDVRGLDALQGRLVPESAGDGFLPVYAPTTALLFAPLTVFSYFTAGALWSTLTMAIYAWALWLAWRPARRLLHDRMFVIAAALAFPPAWQLAVSS